MKKLLGLFILLCISEPLIAQRYPFRAYSIEEGLSESVVNDLVQDNNGYFWFATGYGLNSFDGIRFTSYFEESGLNSNRIQALFKDEDGVLWIGTEAGVNYLKEDSIYANPHLAPLLSSTVTSIYQDSMGEYWFGTESSGVWHYNKAGQLVQYSRSNGLGDNSVRAITEAPSGALWFATRNGITILRDGNFRTFTTNNGLPDNKIWDIKFDQNGAAWIATRNGLAKFRDGQLQIFNEDSGLVNNHVRTLTITDTGIWIGTEEGISFFNGADFRNYKVGSGLSNQIVISSATDREGNIWFGTYAGGVNLFLGAYFENFSTEQNLPNNLVTSITEFRGRIWIGMYGGGITSLHNMQFDDMGVNSHLPDNQVYKLFTDSKNRMWIGMRDGLAIIDENGVNVISDEIFPFRRVRDIMETRDGHYWISTYENGIVFYDGKSVTQYHEENGLADNTVLGSVEGDDGSVWIATYGGVSRFKEGEFHSFGIQEGLPNNGVMNIMKDAEGTIWVSTFGGIAWFNGLKFSNITVADGLPDRIGYFIKQSRDGHYWIGSTKGIIRFDAGVYFNENQQNKAEAFQLITKAQGLVADELNLGAVYEDYDGHFWFGSVDGVSHFDPTAYRGNFVPPQVHVLGIMASGRSYAVSRDLEFNPDENFIEISFTGINFTAPNQIVYEYRLTGIDPGWQSTSETVARYPSLPPGEYEFRLRASNANVAWSEEIKSLKFTIAPPFWMRWWFILLIAGLFAALVYLIYNYYRVRKMVDIERMRVRIASDLHDDVGASLTEIALQSDFLQAGNSDPKLRNSLHQIGEQCRRIVTTLDDIVWSIDARNDSLGDLTDRMQDYVLNTLGQKDISVKYDFEHLKTSNKLPVSVKENLYLIFKEAVNNIAKYSNGTHVEISLESANDWYRLSVYDNGTAGEGKKKSGQGLRNMQLRAERIAADLEINNEHGFRITLQGRLNIK